jgi:hypothetical protein
VAVTITRTRSAFLSLFPQRVFFGALRRQVAVCLALSLSGSRRLEGGKSTPPVWVFVGALPLSNAFQPGMDVGRHHVAKVRGEDNCPPLVPPKSKRDQSTDRRLRESHRGRLHRGQRPTTHRICEVTKDLVSTATRPPNTQFCTPSLASVHTSRPSLLLLLHRPDFTRPPWPRTRSSESFGSSCSSSSRGPSPASAPEFGSSFRYVRCDCSRVCKKTMCRKG